MYGPYNSSSDPLDITGANANYDWGVYNAIVNPKTNTTDPPGTWRTPTIQEWRYFILPEGRNTGSGMRYVHCNVAGVNGIILFPTTGVRPPIRLSMLTALLIRVLIIRTMLFPQPIGQCWTMPDVRFSQPPVSVIVS